MSGILENELMDALNLLQSGIIDVNSDYRIESVADISCVRCSGSAGRYVYEKITTEKLADRSR
jgi:hypothetical protein